MEELGVMTKGPEERDHGEPGPSGALCGLPPRPSSLVSAPCSSVSILYHCDALWFQPKPPSLGGFCPKG